MSENKTVFERLDEIDAKLDKAISGNSQRETIQLPRENPQVTLKRFITRAKKELFLTCSKERYIKGQRKSRIESPFLHLLPADSLQCGVPDDFIKSLSQDDLKAAFAKIFSILEK